jgi:hypothetical protein
MCGGGPLDSKTPYKRGQNYLHPECKETILQPLTSSEKLFEYGVEGVFFGWNIGVGLRS